MMIDVYLLCLCVGFGGLLLMAVVGLGHHAFHGSSHACGPHHHHGHAAIPALHRHGHHHHEASSSAAGSRVVGVPFSWLAWLSPRVLFSLALGFGATGVLLGQWTAPFGWLATLAPALAGAFLFERGIVQPMWRFLFGFASKPAGNLEAALFEEGRAVCNFDAAGHGLVALHVDGQIVQLLGTLCPEERTRGGDRIRSGEPLCVREVNLRRNTCTVARVA